MEEIDKSESEPAVVSGRPSPFICSQEHSSSNGGVHAREKSVEGDGGTNEGGERDDVKVAAGEGSSYLSDFLCPGLPFAPVERSCGALKSVVLDCADDLSCVCDNEEGEKDFSLSLHASSSSCDPEEMMKEQARLFFDPLVAFSDNTSLGAGPTFSAVTESVSMDPLAVFDTDVDFLGNRTRSNTRFPSFSMSLHGNVPFPPTSLPSSSTSSWTGVVSSVIDVEKEEGGWTSSSGDAIDVGPPATPSRKRDREGSGWAECEVEMKSISRENSSSDLYELRTSSGSEATSSVEGSDLSEKEEKEGDEPQESLTLCPVMSFGGSGLILERWTPPEYPACDPLLPEQASEHEGRITLVLDLDETLIHSTADKPFEYHYAVEIDSRIGDEELSASSEVPLWQSLYVKKRPHAEFFLEQVCKHFEVVIFTASLKHYADLVIDGLLPDGVEVHSRLYRESCTFHEGVYVKDLARLGRDVNRSIIVDNSPFSYRFQPENAIGVTSWFEDDSGECRYGYSCCYLIAVSAFVSSHYCIVFYSLSTCK
uniref:FCP1 homology domain-containing protein n=1 Tax=Palpitomonas bilix TaxID=652834 RepID=A0A7S3GAK4_9EUKA|mmetsp:Transcript_40551/g.105265  ORF Transcript_40551/g.105265 Transcript_40551/m.105265 type:complete len:538 (+) Transcript_40551:224-1837(+)